MSEIVEEIPQPDGGRIIIFDDGTRVIEEPGTFQVVPDPSPRVEDRGLGERLLLAQDPGILGQRPIDAGNPEDLAWLRFEITHGNTNRESRPIQLNFQDQFMIIAEHNGWAYLIGRRTSALIAHRITGPGFTRQVSREAYVWGVRGSSAARATWRRDYIRAGGPPILSQQTTDALADTGVPPESALQNRYTAELSWGDIPRAMMLLSQAALQSQDSVRRYTDRFVARYDNEFYGPVVGIIAGILEFGYRLVTDIVGLPAALAQLYDEAGNIFQAIGQSMPLILQGLEQAPGETVLIIIGATGTAITAVTGLGEIGDDLAQATRARETGQGRGGSAYWRHMTSATLRVIELVTIVRALVTALRRIPAAIASMRRQLSRMNNWLRTSRQAMREVRQNANNVEAPQPRRTRPRSEEPDVDEPEARRSDDSGEGQRSDAESDEAPSHPEPEDDLSDFEDPNPNEIPSQRRHHGPERPDENFQGVPEEAHHRQARELFGQARLTNLLDAFRRIDRHVPDAVYTVYRRFRGAAGDLQLRRIRRRINELYRIHGDEISGAARREAIHLLETARDLARGRWNTVRPRLWRELYKVDEVKAVLRDLARRGHIRLPAGFPNTGRAPRAIGIDLRNGRRTLLPLNIDHITPRQMDPFLWFHPRNLRIVNASFNDTFLRLFQYRSGLPMTDDWLEAWVRANNLYRDWTRSGMRRGG